MYTDNEEHRIQTKDKKDNKLNELFELALVENKYEFVDLLIQNGINLTKFLTIERLNYLYQQIVE